LRLSTVTINMCACLLFLLSLLYLLLSFFFFFFQAEDGIRDRNVTGVQTCALPIYSAMSSAARGRLSLLMLLAHSRHCFASLANARSICATTSLGESATTPELVSRIKRALPSS